MNTGTFSLQNYKIYANLLLVSKKRANFATAKPKIGHAGPDGVAIINFLNNNTASFLWQQKSDCSVMAAKATLTILL